MNDTLLPYSVRARLVGHMPLTSSGRQPADNGARLRGTVATLRQRGRQRLECAEPLANHCLHITMLDPVLRGQREPHRNHHSPDCRTLDWSDAVQVFLRRNRVIQHLQLDRR